MKEKHNFLIGLVGAIYAPEARDYARDYAARRTLGCSCSSSLISTTTWLQQPNTRIHDQRPLTGSSTSQRSMDGWPQACSDAESIWTSSRIVLLVPFGAGGEASR